MKRLLLKLFRRRNLERDLEAELAFHREMSQAGGNAIPFGNEAVIREQAYDQWRFNFVENAWRDLSYAARGLVRNPGLVGAALLSLGLGIGANTAMFSLAVEFLLSEPSVADAKSVVLVRLGGASHSKREVIEFAGESGAFQAVTGERSETYINWDDGQETRRLWAVETATNYFEVLAPPVAMGRGYAKGDPTDVAVLTHTFWRKHLNSDPNVIGRGLRLDGRAYTIIGVLPENHRTLTGFGFSPDLYIPQYRESSRLAIYARLKPGMSIGEAQAAAVTVARRLDTVMPDRNKYDEGIQVKPASGFGRLKMERKSMTVALFFALLLVVVGLVLVIACINVAGLLLARASARRQEMAIRLSLGASRGRLLQQLLAESLLLSILGTACGFALAQMVAKTLAAVPLPLPLPVRLQIEPDWRVATYAALLTVVSTLVTGLFPAWQSVKDSIAANLKRERKLRMRRGLVAAQIGVSMVVLTTGVLFVRNLMQATSLSPGFDVKQTVRAQAYLPPVAFSKPEAMDAYIDRSLRELGAVPGIEAAAAARIIPFTDGTTFGTELTFPDTGAKVRTHFHWNAVSPLYFRAMDIPLIAGRVFTDQDRAGSKVVIVNTTFAERVVGRKNPIGVSFLWGEGNQEYRIVGVVAPTKNMTLGEDDAPLLYQPLHQITNDDPRIQFVLRSAIPPATQVGPVREALRTIEPTAAVEVQTLYSAIGLALLPSQIGAVLMGSVGVLGLLLAAIGLYGVMAYSVTRRTREIGIRVAIGAGSSVITRMVLSDAAKLILLGCVPGLLITVFVTRPLAAFFVPGLSPSDPLSFGVVALVLLLAGLVAALGPLRRALTVDAARCLRYE